MKILQSFGLSAALLLAGLGAQAQQRPAGPSYPLGTSQALVRQLETQVDASARRGGTTVTLPVSATTAFTGKVNHREDLAATGEYVVGEIAGVAGSSFSLRIEGKEVEGTIVLRATREAYRYSADAQGNVSVQSVDINKVLCIDYNQPVGYREPAPTRTANRAAAIVSLQSLPGAKGCVLLDFDGQYVSGTRWNNGNPINAAPAAIANDNAKIQAFWELVSEDFRPFSMNITTDEAVFNSYPKGLRMRCIVTPTTTAAPRAGGVAYVGSFRWTDDTPCWVFMSEPKSGGEASSHEVGHTLGLSHDGRISPQEDYYSAQGSAGAWAPIMGVGYYKPVSQWSRGEYNSANNKEDDLAIIASSTYNVGYRADDHSNSTTSATALARSGTSLSGNGIIERAADQDYFSFTTSGGAVSLNVNTVSRYGNLDIVARLFDSGGGLLGTYDTAGNNNLNVSISTTLGAGTYYLQVDGTGSGNPATDGYSDYASLGTFTISGTAPTGGGGTTPPPPPTGGSYCASKGGTQQYEYLAQVSLGSINRTSGADGGYYDGTAVNTNIAQGSAQTITYQAGFPSSTYSENVKVYIDWNRDGDFADASETVASGTTSSATAQTASFTVPATATTGKTRLRVVLSDNASTTSCGSYEFGETEDYSVTVTTGGTTPPPTTSCGVAAGLNASALSSSGATVAWTAVSGATSYNVRYRNTSTTTWTSTTSTSTSKALTGLTASTNYEFQVQTVCSSGNSAFSASATFTTGTTTTPQPPTTATYCTTRSSSQDYEWIDLVNLGSINRTSGADGGYYNGTATSTSIATGSSQTINFSAGFAGDIYTEYWKVYIDWNQNGVFTDAGELLVSGSTSSAATFGATFTVPTTAKLGQTRLRLVMSDNSATTSCGSYDFGETEDYTVNITGAAATAALVDPATAGLLNVYPNPATDRLNLELPLNTEVLKVSVRDVRGTLVSGCSYENGQLNVSGLASGLYTVQVSDEHHIFTQRFIKQ
ncbi:GEVED domain-containing protein [Hymenobacter terrenus]|uniref:GEVED domain-containing protein n=1 Tax=Hymenobacter terrenus TaxID=1629124 RepID=UPI000697222E|nr:GEVED domain-containing protein [Hymenobacter terrenus]